MQTADNAGVVEDEIDDETLGTGVEDPETGTPEGEAGGKPGETPEDEGEIEITLGEAAAPAAEEDDASAPEWVRNLRKENRELKRALKDREHPGTPAEPDAPVLGPRPTLADHDYDEDAHAVALDKWYADKKAVDDHKAGQQRKVDEAKAEQQKVLNTYQDAAKKLRVPDFKAAEETVVGALSEAQQGIILNGADDPAKLVYVLGKYPEKLKQLASIANPVKFAFAVSKLEREVKVTPRTKPNPESTIPTGSAARGGGNATLDRLRAEAEKTGDYSKVTAYKRQQRAKQ